ncbi:Cytochrome P450 2J3 [Holothuria leucospilota]|uniref:Cytochrome P450 2J3 n=1 Tax=Holothuria leucospilota TaxID=206669 RepID=A0A9Q1BAR5_HOLLE|nr:Cytochrome P450 2J3 [Holothuria leucospilota]
MELTILLALTFFLLMAWLFAKRGQNFPPGPNGLPIVGSIFALLNNPFQKLKEYADTYGPVYTLKIGPIWVIMLNDAATIQELFTTRSGEFSERPKLIADVTGFGENGIVLLPSGSYHKRQKKVAMSLFRDIGVGNEKFDHLLRPYLDSVMKSLPDNPCIVNIENVCSETVSNIIGGFTFGDKVYNDNSDVSQEIRKLIRQNFENNPILIVGNTYLPKKLCSLLGHFVDMENNISKMKKLLKRMMESHYFKKENKHQLNCFVPKYLEEYATSHAGEELWGNSKEENQLVGIIIDFFQAGCETTAVSLQWLLLLLAANPEVQTKIQQEIDDLFGEELPSLQQKSKLNYTVATMYESLRIRPSAPLGAPHCTKEDTTILGYQIPAGTPILSNLLSAQLNPQTFPDPHVFKPERFLDENGNICNLGSLLTFGTGPRTCLGEQLAKSILLSIVINILQKYTLRKKSEGCVDLSFQHGINLLATENELLFSPRTSQMDSEQG